MPRRTRRFYSPAAQAQKADHMRGQGSETGRLISLGWCPPCAYRLARVGVTGTFAPCPDCAQRARKRAA